MGGSASSPTVALLDYGSGNLHSAHRALLRAGADVTVTSDRSTVMAADGLVVPGVGAYAACVDGLRGVRGDELIDKRLAGGKPVLGICVGMQVLFERGVEFGIESEGCGQWPGVVSRLDAPVVPHMGWNTVTAPADSVLFAGADPDTRYYFVHSFAALTWDMPPSESLAPAKVTYAHHGVDFVAAVENGPLSATQFHPEKSGDAGARLLRNWVTSL